MVKATFSVLSEADKQLVLETEPRKLDGLTETQLLDLHGRVRRSRNRHTKLYRREGAGRVRADKARGKASAKSRRHAARAEVFEDALARVSRRLAAAARASASELRAARLARAGQGAKAAKAGPKPSKKASKKAAKKGKASHAHASATRAKGAGKAKGTKTSPATKKAHASTLATGKRRQAKKDRR